MRRGLAGQEAASPQPPTPTEHAELVLAAQLAALAAPETIAVRDGRARVEFPIPRQGVSLIKLAW